MYLPGLWLITALGFVSSHVPCISKAQHHRSCKQIYGCNSKEARTCERKARNVLKTKMCINHLCDCVCVCVFRCVSICETPCKIRNNCPRSLWKAHDMQQSIRSSHVVSKRDVPECISQVAVAALGWPERAVQGDGGLADAWAVYCAIFVSIVAVEGALRMNGEQEKTWKSDFSVLIPEWH